MTELSIQKQCASLLTGLIQNHLISQLEKYPRKLTMVF